MPETTKKRNVGEGRPTRASASDTTSGSRPACWVVNAHATIRFAKSTRPNKAQPVQCTQCFALTQRRIARDNCPWPPPSTQNVSAAAKVLGLPSIWRNREPDKVLNRLTAYLRADSLESLRRLSVNTASVRVVASIRQWASRYLPEFRARVSFSQRLQAPPIRRTDENSGMSK